jgi:hypothetical protein
MDVVRHEAVRKKRELFVDRRAPKLHIHSIGALARDEEWTPFICAESQEVSISAGVVEGVQMFRFARDHGATTANDAPSV